MNMNEQEGYLEDQQEQFQEEPGEGDVDEGLVEELINQAKALLYGEHFEPMMKVFESAKGDAFPQAMATVVVGVIDRLEQDNGEQSNATLATVAIGLVAMLSTDLVNGKVLQLNADQIQLAVQATIGMWMKGHPDRVDMEGMQREVAEGVMGGEADEILAVAGGPQLGQQMPPEQQMPQQDGGF